MIKKVIANSQFFITIEGGAWWTKWCAYIEFSDLGGKFWMAGGSLGNTCLYI